MPSILCESLVQRITDCTRRQASAQNSAVCISVVDAAGLLKGFLRMDNAVPGAIDVAIKKPVPPHYFKPTASNSANRRGPTAQPIPLSQPTAD
ncbi:heme-binding protein [Apirhabdus apintestini]|nr:heme-binding protein [Enterobacteriaceae bacterium CA-0114]